MSMNNRPLSGFFLSVGAMILANCASPPSPSPSVAPIDCAFPGTNTPAPAWICDEKISGVGISAVGVAEKSAAGLSFMKDIAAADARGKLATRLKTEVEQMIKNYVGTTGVGNTETVDRLSESITRTIAKENLIGSHIIKSLVGPHGRIYVLIGMNPEARKQALQNSVKSSYDNERALWQRFRGDKAFEELQEQVDKQVPPN